MIDSSLVGRLERTEAATVFALVKALGETGCTDPVPRAVPFRTGIMVVSGARRYVNRAVGVTLAELRSDDVAAVVRHYTEVGLSAQVQLSSWAPTSTVAALGGAGFVPVSCRSMFAIDPGAPPADESRCPYRQPPYQGRTCRRRWPPGRPRCQRDDC